jgi:alginate O-acetyltransferase complex protein AlgI
LTIISPVFIIFVLAVLILYYFLPRRAQNILLLAASYGFLVVWGWAYALVFALLTAANYILARRLAGTHSSQRMVLWAGIGINLAALAYFKHADFFIPYVVYYLKRIDIVLDAPTLIFLLPLGLSFYVVQAIAYLMDVRRGLVDPPGDVVDFALYMVYFPRLIAGPIERGRNLLPQLSARRVVDNQVLRRAFTLILVGLVRKVVIADSLLQLLPEEIFNNPSAYMAPDLGIWLAVYGVVLYNDFAGYTSLVRGVSELFGIQLSPNFATPYFARSFSEFWQRWHITLSDWLRDYIFTPLTRTLLRGGMNSRHPATLILPPLATMLVSGFWHGATQGMLLWGALHALFQIGERLINRYYKVKPAAKRPVWRQAAGGLVIFTLVTLAWVPFRMALPQAFDYWLGLFDPAGWQAGWSALSLPVGVYVLCLLLTTISLGVDYAQRAFGELILMKGTPMTRALAFNAAIILIIIAIAAHQQSPPPFIYQEF